MEIKKILFVLFAVVYFISPVDLLPGVLVDDFLVIAFSAYKALSSSQQQES